MHIDSKRQQTIKQEITYTGTGLHTGNQQITITCKPLTANSGIRFKRTDLPSAPEIEAVVDNIVSTKRSTSLGTDQWQISTVEHLLAALNGLKIDNLLIEIDAGEVPITDGSSLVFTELLQKAGIKQQNKKCEIHAIEEAVWAREGDTYLVALPGPELKITYTFVSDHPAVGNQFGEFTIDEKTFINQIAPSRTFGFASEIEALQEEGLALGGSLDNAVLIGEEEIVNELRFEDEIVRHKILDIIGDLALIKPFRGHIIAVRSGHALNRRLAHKIKQQVMHCW
ncbi:UDP-3-O-acyl-N-acetylglucosamine deacetylase [Acetohalobium arabaticum]|uniref:UDP-3-O-acyl-N-acetylglucosamine deacetylase n=1 Tax=Acetohalobium arabaticum (strain ATCC 49924 / DSM 5501 / Z-7288) TaxID=574087 RepID=D9QTV8_ACEAZ|nr:UDP-3-O-acyl-N-acetylglucosamine deacetylase [Acetohalobium arabaticum]ADL13679.1 UDP-3-0-acyl N-acetylglucosamine deacetylase [Acetohalobium arabaticum DSM 5501]